MPIRSLSSAVLRWPGRDEVLAAARRWAESLRNRDPHVAAVYCVGSYARGDWGVGSDLDVIVLLASGAPAMSSVVRRERYEPREVPVPADVWVYTPAEWEALAEGAPHVMRRVGREQVDL